MEKFLLNNNGFEFNSKTYQQKSGAVIETKFAPLFFSLRLYLHGQIKQKFLETWKEKPLIWSR